jgi:hypothetical protein
MGKWRNISGDDRIIGYGVPMATTVAADEVAVVDDGADEAYDNQPTIWERVSDAPGSTPSASKKAAPSAPTSDSPSTDAAAS